MTKGEIMSHVDHTLLKADATWPAIAKLCDEAVENATASICINSGYVRQAAETVDDTVLGGICQRVDGEIPAA